MAQLLLAILTPHLGRGSVLRKSLSIIVLLFSTVVAPAARAVPLPLYVFGDSLSDAGNAYLLTGGALPLSPYVNREYSNGPNWIEDLASRLGDAPLTPSLAGGTDYAYGGASTAPLPFTTNPADTDLAGPTGQIAQFLSAHPSADPNALYVVDIGSNDVIDILNKVAMGTGPTLAMAEADLNVSVTKVDKALDALAGAGAKNFLLVTVGDQAPRVQAWGLQAEATILSSHFDSVLQAGTATIPSLSTIESMDDIHISVFNYLALVDAVVAHPSAYGFTDVTDPCYTGTLAGFSDVSDPGTVCATPDQYFFWDDLHPTAAGQAVIADAAFDALPEPSSLPMLLAGLGMIAGAFYFGRRTIERGKA